MNRKYNINLNVEITDYDVASEVANELSKTCDKFEGVGDYKLELTLVDAKIDMEVHNVRD